jgi:hypothetical protein
MTIKNVHRLRSGDKGGYTNNTLYNTQDCFHCHMLHCLAEKRDTLSHNWAVVQELVSENV